MDINADLGEGGDCDALLMPLIDRANIACGGHAGDRASMRAALRLVRQYGVKAGAHPSYPDREGFGRIETGASPAAIEADCIRQLTDFRQAADDCGVTISHVKPHGALYHRLMQDASAADAFLRAVNAVSVDAAVMGLPASVLQRQARLAGVGYLVEMFADRYYEADGQLTPRSHPRALIETLETALGQVLSVRDGGGVRARTGQFIALHADCVCVHGDGEHALVLARALRRVLAGPRFWDERVDHRTG
ncbi:5-oxoprolinase subunit PxpA [uncultured Thiodictyon sp.]|uniref:5-oxoprolinase subunit PxpA n=1 Tax=uncultured Thiodictyon sp. TaxID=1846217 RepID=UPI0025DA08CF|nr:5-oxoprolinase subunit PxpA [uncultured Thiodictyon sp.]